MANNMQLQEELTEEMFENVKSRLMGRPYIDNMDDLIINTIVRNSIGIIANRIKNSQVSDEEVEFIAAMAFATPLIVAYVESLLAAADNRFIEHFQEVISKSHTR